MITIKQVSHHYTMGKKAKETIVPVLHGIDLHVGKGEIVSLIGKSGSGKSTLLHIIGGFIQPTSGEVAINGTMITGWDEGRLADFRLEHIGYIFQNFQLIPSMTAAQNIELPLILNGTPKQKRKQKVEDILRQVELEAFPEHYPSELSGGQQQRVAIARALILDPPLILADEPTGSLDSDTEADLLSLIRKLNKQAGITFLIITHDQEVAAIADRQLEIRDGQMLKVKGVMPV
ncbi:ABC transporter ATP-binding protein [Terribacillus saccharophilus]|uniref:ABC transporter ATP-binding protein n=1 Tax=Terribacillus saccharophilus TaxID=361277 RepID=A0A268A7X7_9BACI|nr:ABC transporter ATP-binding protein [Terribacillus saccharophilus]PAD20225.1 ABC transporter ATP-binding protein [Terribacillus saccharophilus]PAF18334.1 ABC transporter ATP-binding protein [Terribacillus saccharophilus]PAF20840.1 ABC transporter ATP-binding protein [Terribacillus saccharophilus]PAF35769.1 ABC transporter ATP-binding protein [Terribacillus saccharophilus]